MNRELHPSESISEAFVESVCARLAEHRRVRRRLPKNGWLNLDQPLPFLCLYRMPPGRRDAGTRQLVKGEAAYLIAPGDAALRKSLTRLVTRLAELGAAQFGAFLLIELFAAPEETIAPVVHPESGEWLSPVPAFRVLTRGEPNVPLRTVGTLQQALEKVRVDGLPATVERLHHAVPGPPGLKPLLSLKQARRIGCYQVGLEVRPVFRDPETGDVFPRTLRRLRRGVGRALKQAVFHFAHSRTTMRPQHYYALGRRKLNKAVWEVDAQLSAVSDSFDFLLQATPVNVEAAWREFRRGKFQKTPVFHYRPLTMDPVLVKRRLYEIPVEKIEDPTLAHLFRQKQEELDRKIAMLADIGSRRFLLGSLQLYGEVEPPLLQLAEDILQRTPARRRESSGRSLSAAEFAEKAKKEIKTYRRRFPAFQSRVVLRDDMYSGLLVSQGDLLIGRKTTVDAGRVEALLQHEIGTHVLTYYNGLAQPLRQLHSGLAGYDGLQEGLAVLAEYLAGGLSPLRLRILAARVVAVYHLAQGAAFPEIYRLLERTHGFTQRTAYTITMRVYRAGGLTKDAIYLRGLVEILDYLSGGGELEPLFIGKLAVDHVPVVRELLHRQVLRPPPLRPRYMNRPGITERLARLARGLSVLDLLEDKRHANRVRRQQH